MSREVLPTLGSVARDLAAGLISSRDLVSACLERIAAASGEGARTFLKVYTDQALVSADFHDEMRQRGSEVSPFAGIPLSVKDLFDVAGDTTLAGSTALQGAPPATRDATAVARLRAAGFIVIGRTNMTEFAFSGVGINPHYGTPLNPWDRVTQRIPGGSSSGAAVSVTDRMAFVGLGTDTGGSCRIPAALCGIVGFKPTARRVPRDGTYPLSPTLDSIGPLARSVACCAAVDAVLCGSQGPRLQGLAPDEESSPLEVGGLRLGVLSSYVTEDMDRIVAQNYERALRDLGTAGAKLTDVVLPELTALPELNRKGGIAAAEAFAHHREQLEKHTSLFDPRVASRILRGREQSAADYIDLLNSRSVFIDQVGRRVAPFDAVLMPTTPVVAPALSELVPDDGYWRFNALMLRNPSIVNFLDGCAISIPCQQPDCAPVGLTLFGLRDSDRRLLTVAAAAERCLAGSVG